MNITSAWVINHFDCDDSNNYWNWFDDNLEPYNYRLGGTS